MDERRGIGVEGRLPWRLADDLKRFKELTMGHHIILGRKTYESIGRPLPGRQTIVVTRNRELEAPGCLIAHSVEDALEIARSSGETEAFICGGADLYAQTIGIAHRLYLTLVHTETYADTFFPDWEEGEWISTDSSFHAADHRNQYPFTTRRLVRKAGV
jgi:dihydrofolate reductase